MTYLLIWKIVVDTLKNQNTSVKDANAPSVVNCRRFQCFR